MTGSEMAGFAGTTIAGAAYVPQIWHLFHERCSAGISRVAFGAWLLAAALITTHAIASKAVVFIALGAVQLTATMIILVAAAKYKNSYCERHIPVRGVSA